MATIKRREGKNGASYLIRSSCGYDVTGKQIMRSMTWRPKPGMTEKQIEVYEGVLKALPERNMKQVINGLYNLERFEFLPGIQCDNEIGEMTIDNDLDPICRETFTRFWIPKRLERI